MAVCVDLMTPVRWLFYENMAAHYRVGAKVPEQTVIFRFLVSHGAQVYRRVLNSVPEVKSTITWTTWRTLDVSEVSNPADHRLRRGNSRGRSAAGGRSAEPPSTRAVLLRSAGRATIVEDCDDERARRSVSLIAQGRVRAEVYAAVSTDMADRPALDFAFGGAGGGWHERRHREGARPMRRDDEKRQGDRSRSTPIDRGRHTGFVRPLPMARGPTRRRPRPARRR